MKKVTIIEPTLRPAARKRVAAYARVSMETDRLLHSLSAQISYYSEFIQSNPEWIYAGVYADTAVSGTGTAKRTEFNRLIEDCEKGMVDIVLVKSISRFARNTVDLLNTVRHLRDIGVDIWFEEEHIHSMDKEGELMLTLLASFAQEESRSISENAKWGIRKGYEKGEFRCSLLYGYRFKNHCITICENEAEIVRRIFKMFLDGDSCYLISKKLNEEEIPSYRGKKWSTFAILAMLRQEKYTGNSLMQKFYTESHVTHKIVRNKGELPMYYAEHTHPAIISEDLFRRAQEEFSSRYGTQIVNGIAEPCHDLFHRGGCESRDVKEGDEKPFRRKAQWSEKQRQEHSKLFKTRELTPHPIRHDLSLFIKCEGCGENLTAKIYRYTDGTPSLRWNCNNHTKRSPATPAPMHLRDTTVKKIICEVLGMSEFNVKMMCERLTHISVLHNRLTFHFKDGHIEQRIYAHEKRKRCPRRKQ